MHTIKQNILFWMNIILILCFTIFYYSCSKENTNKNEMIGTKADANQDNNDHTDNDSKTFFSLSAPSYVYGSKYSLMSVSMTAEGYQNELQMRAGYLPVNSINILFYDLSNSDYKLLFSRPVIIVGLDYPTDKKGKEQKFILYRAIIKDSNNDKKLDDDDNIVLFETDLDGNNLTQITDSKVNLVEYHKLGQNRILIIVSIPNGKIPKNNWSTNAIVYDISAKKTINSKFDLMLEKSKKIFNSFK
jgi:hypothetical protein